jgi:hypothetical protein
MALAHLQKSDGFSDVTRQHQPIADWAELGFSRERLGTEAIHLFRSAKDTQLCIRFYRIFPGFS